MKEKERKVAGIHETKKKERSMENIKEKRKFAGMHERN